MKPVISLCALLLSLGLTSGEEKPNILFIFTDDQTAYSLKAYGNEEIETPHLDRLAERGATFENAYHAGSYAAAICKASRLMVLTGSSVWKAASYTTMNSYSSDNPNGPQVGERYFIPPQEAPGYWPQYMKKAGYETYMTGKWHVPTQAQKLFDHVEGVKGGMPNSVKHRYKRPMVEGEPDTWSPTDISLGGFWNRETGEHLSKVQADTGIRYLHQAAQSDDPFFIFLSFSAPHDPRQSPQEYLDKYPLDKIKLPKSFLPEYPYNVISGARHGLRDEKLAPFPRTEYAVKKNRQEYYGLISHLDAQIGRVLQALEESGKAENTYILFTSDHGLSVGHHGLMGKQNMYEHSLKVPLLYVGPGIQPGTRVSAPVYLQDVMPTAIELAGEDIPEHVDFHSLTPLARGDTTEGSYEAIYGAYFSTQRMIRKGDYKMIMYPVENIVRLYNLAEDPEELHDLVAAGSASEETLKELFNSFTALAEEQNDPIDLTDNFQSFLSHYKKN